MQNRLTILMTAGALCAAALLGQGRGARGWSNNGTPPDPAKMVEFRVQRLQKILSLTDAQVTQATTIFKTAADASSALRTQLQTAHESLAAAVKDNNTAAIEQAAAALGALHGQMLAIQSKADAAFYQILSADQRTRYDELGPHGFGMGGPGGPRMMRGPARGQ